MELLVFIILFIDRGKQFRREFANISEVRSLVPAGVKIMALTATASKSSRKQIINTLCMEDVQVIAVTPNRANITYHVKRWEDGMSEAMDDVIGRLVEKRNKCERTIIYTVQKRSYTLVYCTVYITNILIIYHSVYISAIHNSIQ